MIGKFESNKDLIQELTTSGARHVGNIASIITGTVQEVTREIGEWITDAIEMNEAAAAARRDAESPPDNALVEAEVVEPEVEKPR
jgi:ribosomal protein S17E